MNKFIRIFAFLLAIILMLIVMPTAKTSALEIASNCVPTIIVTDESTIPGEEENQTLTLDPIPYQEIEEEPQVAEPIIDVIPYEADIYEMAKIIYTEARGVSPLDNACRKTQWSAVVWTILNRADRDGASLKSVYSAPGQFAYNKKIKPTQEMIDVAYDTVYNWLCEKEGIYHGRVLPQDYTFFCANKSGTNNVFRNKFSGNYTKWDWSLKDYYKCE